MRKLLFIAFTFLCIHASFAIITTDPVTGNGTVVNGPNTPPPNCAGSQPAGNTCQESTYICDLNGYCGNTSAAYTVNTWTELTNTFVGSIENNSFVSFTAGASTVSFTIWVYNCTYNEGIQLMIFSANNCQGTVVNQLSWNPGNVPASSQIVTVNGLTAGQNYYIMIDGFNGDVCSYAIATNQNSNILVPPTITASATTLCPGEPVTLTASGGNGVYNWIAGNGLPANSNGTSVTFTPPGPGTYTYSTLSAQGNPNCTEEGQGEITIVVESCGCTVTANADQTEFCEENLSPINLTAELDMVGTISWTGPNGFTSNQDNPTNVSLPTAPGTYQYTATGIANGIECVANVDITIHPTPAGTIANAPTLTCANPTAQVTVNGTNATQINWNLNGTSVGTNFTQTIDQPGNYVIELTSAQGCTSTFEQAIAIDDTPPAFTLSTPEVLTCLILETDITVNNPQATYTYAWTGPSILNGTNTNSITVGAIGNYQVVATNPVNGCTSTQSSTVTNNLSAPEITIGQTPQINCAQPSITIATQLVPANSFVQWSGPNGYTANTQNATVSEGGAFIIEATHPLTGCTSEQQAFITTNFTMPSSLFTADILSECTPFTSTLTAQAFNEAYTYAWYVNGQIMQSTGPQLQVSLTDNSCQTIELIVQNSTNGCVSNTQFTDYICGIMTPIAGITATPPYLMGYDDPMVNFSCASQHCTGHYWILPNETQDNSEILSYDFSNHQTGQLFTIIAHNNNQCFDTIQYFLAINNDVYLYVPNTFTPDGDARNNDFQAIITGDFDPQTFNMYIYNRWGEMVWESHDHSIAWDGTYNGKLVPDGSYTWSIDFKRFINDEKKSYTGNITLLR